MDLEDLWAVEPSLRSGFYIQPISLLNPIETSKTVSNLYVERDTGKYHEFIAGIVYECAARVNNAGGNERVMFPRYRVLQW